MGHLTREWFDSTEGECSATGSGGLFQLKRRLKLGGGAEWCCVLQIGDASWIGFGADPGEAISAAMQEAGGAT